MSENWVIQNLQNSLDTWNNKLAEVWTLLLTSPSNFKGGHIWEIMLNIHGALKAIGYALVVLFFLTGVIRTCGSFAEFKKPEHAIKVFIRLGIAKAVVSYGLDLMLALFDIIQGIIIKIMNTAGVSAISKTTLPKTIEKAIDDCGFFESIPLWAVTLIGSLFIIVMSFIVVLTVYGRFFKLYMYTALAPIPLSTFAGEPTQSIGVSFLKSYAGVCLEGAIIVIACIIFSAYTGSAPTINTNLSATTMVWSYIGELVFNMCVLVGAVKMADITVKQMLGI